MSFNNKGVSALLFTLLLAAPVLSWSQALPDVRTLGAISYVSGGIGLDEVAYMRSISQEYNLRLSFAISGSGEYASDVAVDIKGSTGQVLMSVKSEGPFFFAKLPAGSYEIGVTYGGVAQSRKVTIGEKGTSALGFYWPSQN